MANHTTKYCLLWHCGYTDLVYGCGLLFGSIILGMAKVGRPSKYKPEYCEAVVQHMADGASLTSFAADIDVGRQTIARWINEHEEFRYAVTRGKAKCAAWWEKVARANAVTGDGNATLTVFGLTNMAADDWKKTEHVDHTTQGEKIQ